MKPHSNGRALGLALGIALMSSTSCQGRDSTVRHEAGGEAAVRTGDSVAPNESMVRVVHAIAAEGPVDVFAGHHRTFASVPFRGVTRYTRVTSNTPTFRISRAAQERDTLAEEKVVTRDGQYFTLLAMAGDDSGTVDMKVLRDDVERRDAARARIRVINAAPKSGKLDVFLGQDETPLFDSLDVQDEGGYRDVDPGTVTVMVRPHDRRNVLLSIPGVTLTSGTRLTLVLTRISPRSRRLSAIRLTDDDRGKPAAARDSGR